MIKLIIGLKGTGKTKALIDEVNKASRESNGAVICVEYGRKLNYEIKYQARLIDAKDYKIKDSTALYGFICGILAGNYDVTELFIDSALKICGDDVEGFEKFMLALNDVLKAGTINCLITSSISEENLPESLKTFVTAAS